MATAIQMLRVVRNGRTVLLPETEDVTAGPEIAKLGLWILDHKNHSSMRFQTARGRLDVNVNMIGREDGSGTSWMVFGEIKPESDADASLYAIIWYETTRRKGSVTYTTTPPTVLRP